MVATYLKGVIISPGMFSSEVAVCLKDHKGAGYSCFFNKQFVRDGMLEVCVLLEAGQLALVQPADRGDGSEFLNGARSLTVRKSELAYL